MRLSSVSTCLFSVCHLASSSPEKDRFSEVTVSSIALASDQARCRSLLSFLARSAIESPCFHRIFSGCALHVATALGRVCTLQYMYYTENSERLTHLQFELLHPQFVGNPDLFGSLNRLKLVGLPLLFSSISGNESLTKHLTATISTLEQLLSLSGVQKSP